MGQLYIYVTVDIIGWRSC